MAAPNVAVIQPLPGVGDMIWHLPHIRAIAASIGAPITLVAKPRSAAGQVFAAETTIRDIVWMDRNPAGRRGRHDGPLGLWRLARDLRERHFDRAILLHHSQSLAFAMAAAGIPVRQGYGAPGQRLFLNQGPWLTREELRIDWWTQACTWVARAGIPMTEQEPKLAILPEARAAVRQRLGAGPVVTVGLGASELYKQWGAERFTALIRLMLSAGWSRFVLMGGDAQAGIAAEIRAGLGADAGCLVDCIGWPLTEVAAALAESDLYVGNDTSFLNMAAAVGIRTYGLFGATPPFHHSTQIVPITTPDGEVSRVNGMERITPEAAMAVLRADGAAPRPAVLRAAGSMV